MAPQFEFHIYRGDLTAKPEVIFDRLRTDGAARNKAGRLAKTAGGPVDLAFAGSADWSDRYLTTASPSEFHSSGYRFERLA